MNKKGFTLIELLAVIIILGILMIIAIPSVTKYINDSRKSSYIDTAKELVSGARNLVNDGKLEMYDTDATYYIDIACLKTENGGKAVSPYGDFVKDRAFVVVTFDGKGYEYFWTSIDDSGQGIKDLVRYDKLDTDKIESDLKTDDIKIDRGIDGRSKVILIRDTNNCQKEGSNDAGQQVNGETGIEIINYLCKKATVLHEVKCNRSGSGCGSIVSLGHMITYGTIPNGTFKPGDAYDCDVNGDGTFDSETERFYYLKSYGDTASLIYYKSMNNQGRYAYNSANTNNYGPMTAYQYLPNLNEWNNQLIVKPGTRQILNEIGTNTVNNGNNTLSNFNYNDKAARLLTYQEVQTVCNKTDLSNSKSLNDCYFLMEDIIRFETGSGMNYGYWLETSQSTSDSNAFLIIADYNYVSNLNASYNTNYGVRPVITVKKNNIEK